MTPPRGPVGVVLVSGGARGAYQAGALSVLLPALDELGLRPRIWAGSSAGALTAVVAAAAAHLPAAAQAAAVVDAWRRLRKRDVLVPMWLQTPRMAVSYVGEVVGVPGLGMRGLLGTDPLRRALHRVMDLEQLHRNVDRGVVDAVAVLATAIRTGTTVAFVESGRPLPAPGSARVRWAGTRLGVEHALASCAIPLLMPAVEVRAPASTHGWYVDGSVSLRTPVLPAIDLGARQVVVVGLTPLTPPEGADGDPVDPRPTERPDLADGASTLLDALLDDALVADLRWVTRDEDDEAGGALPHLLVAPESRGEIAELALAVLHDRYGGVRGLRDPDFPLIHRLLGGHSQRQGDLMSYLLFDEGFIDALIDMGARDARRRLSRRPGDGVWHTGPPSALR